MTEAPLSNVIAKLDAVKDAMTVKRVFGDAYEVNGTTIIPVAAVRGGGGGGGGEGTAPDQEETGSGAGMGFGVNDRPVGVYIHENGTTTWSPAVDVTRIVLGGQLVALAAIVVIGRVLRHREHHRHRS
jgi:uncharacterized spore protein YtfJ